MLDNLPELASFRDIVRPVPRLSAATSHPVSMPAHPPARPRARAPTRPPDRPSTRPPALVAGVFFEADDAHQ